MIGYMRPIKSEFNSEQRKIYQAVYCGLCRKLKHQHGVLGTLALNYEIVNMLLLVDSLRADKPERIKISCSLSPLIWREVTGINEQHYFAAAELSMIIVNLEIKDNVEDEKHMKDRALLAVSNRKLQRVIKQSDNLYLALKDSYSEYMEKEDKALKALCGFESVVETCGRIAGDMGYFVSEAAGIQDEETATVKEIMDIWGKWIYLIDAVDDFFEDEKYNHFNPWILKDAPKNWENYVKCLENKAFSLVGSLSVLRYKDVLEKLYRIQFPERRRRVFDKYYKRAGDEMK